MNREENVKFKRKISIEQYPREGRKNWIKVTKHVIPFYFKRAKRDRAGSGGLGSWSN
jgi:hypothetical protein